MIWYSYYIYSRRHCIHEGLPMSTASPTTSFLSATRGKLTLALLASVAFIDFVDASIVNVALPSIRRDLGFSVQDLQWVPSGYLLTYGGFMLLGGRAGRPAWPSPRACRGHGADRDRVADRRLGAELRAARRRRFAQGIGAAMMLPAALSILTTAFKEGRERNTALGVWGAMGGLASAAGVLLGGLLTEGPGWRWVMFVNPIAVRASAGRHLPAAPGRPPQRAVGELRHHGKPCSPPVGCCSWSSGS